MRPVLFTIFLFIFTTPSWSQTELDYWQVENGTLIHSGSPLDSLASLYWRLTKKILPDSPINKYVSGMRLTTDGLANDMGGLTATDSTNDSWELDIDIADMRFWNKDSALTLDYYHTLIHEFAHLISLNGAQISPTIDDFEDPSKGYLTQEGYANEESYLGAFVEKFWRGYYLKKWDKIMFEKNDRVFYKKIYKFYAKNSFAFVNDYAAENPEEDFAESWTFFILDEKPEENEIKHQKINFFYNFPELIQYRKEIRANLDFTPNDYLNQYPPTY